MNHPDFFFFFSRLPVCVVKHTQRGNLRRHNCLEDRQDQWDVGDHPVAHRQSVCLWPPPLTPTTGLCPPVLPPEGLRMSRPEVDSLWSCCPTFSVSVVTQKVLLRLLVWTSVTSESHVLNKAVVTGPGRRTSPEDRAVTEKFRERRRVILAGCLNTTEKGGGANPRPCWGLRVIQPVTQPSCDVLLPTQIESRQHTSQSCSTTC